MSNGNRNNKTLVALVVILLLSNIGLLLYFFVFNTPGNHQGPQQRPDFSVVDYMKKEIGFSDDQAKTFEQLHLQNRDSLKLIGDSIRANKNNLYKLLQQPQKPADAEVAAAVAAISVYQQRLEMTMFRHFEKVRAICTPEQQVKFDTMVTRMNNRSPWFRRGGRKPDDRPKK